MTDSIALVDLTAKVIIGVDTHKHVHVAVAINLLGARVADRSARADRAGYAELVGWARTLGVVEAFGIEGTGSYGVGLASFVRRQRSAWSRSIIAIGVSVATTARATPSMPRPPPGRCWRGSRRRSRRPPMAPLTWSARSRLPATPP